MKDLGKLHHFLGVTASLVFFFTSDSMRLISWSVMG
jgi:hypothetical protein